MIQPLNFSLIGGGHKIALPQEQKNLNINIKNNNDSNISETPNLFFVGENYEVLSFLQLTHTNKIDLIYIDPPYNTEATFKDKNNLTSDITYKSKKFTYRDKFLRTGWLNLMKERLIRARKLLSETGMIFISIDDNEQAYLKILMDEIFEERNFVTNLIIQSSAGMKNKGVLFQSNYEYCLVYAKDKNSCKVNWIKDVNQNNLRRLDDAPDSLLKSKTMGSTLYFHPSTKDIVVKNDYDKTKIHLNDIRLVYENDKQLIYKGYIPIRPAIKNNSLWRWRWGKEKMTQYKNKIIFKKDRNGRYIPYAYPTTEKLPPENIWSFTIGTNQLKEFELEKKFPYPKNVEFIKEILKVASKPNSIVLDFFAGSGTTAQAVMELNREDNGNRKFILVTNEGDTENINIAMDICYERLHRLMLGKATDGRSNYKWITKNKPFLNEKLLVFKNKYYSCSIHTDANGLIELAKKEFMKINYQFDKIDDYELVNSLNALNWDSE